MPGRGDAIPPLKVVQCQPDQRQDQRLRMLVAPREVNRRFHIVSRRSGVSLGTSNPAKCSKAVGDAFWISDRSVEIGAFLEEFLCPLEIALFVGSCSK